MQRYDVFFVPPNVFSFFFAKKGEKVQKRRKSGIKPLLFRLFHAGFRENIPP
jgi:hypothetical protein